MKRVILSALMLGLTATFTGCGDETKVEKKETVTTPGGSMETKKTETTTKTGDMKDEKK